MAVKWRSGVGEILGAAIAHEVGHLLLGVDAHSAYGVMKATWSRTQFELIGLGELNFSADQAKMLRERIEKLTMDGSTLATRNLASAASFSIPFSAFVCQGSALARPTGHRAFPEEPK
jgi:hypothetical protein